MPSPKDEKPDDETTDEFEQMAFDALPADESSTPSGPPPAKSHDWRLQRAEQAREAHRERQAGMRRDAWAPDSPSRDLDRLPLPHDPASDSPNSKAMRMLLNTDVTWRIFGRTVAYEVPPFGEPASDDARPDALRRLDVFGRIDYDLTLASDHRGVSFTTGQLRAGGTRKVVRGVPSDHPIRTRILELLDRGGLAPEWVLTRYAHPLGSSQTVKDHIRTLLAYGLIEYTTFRITDHVTEGRLPRLYRLTAKGWNRYLVPKFGTGRKRYEAPLKLTPTALSRIAHHVGALSYAIELIDRLPHVTDYWFTPAWPDGHIDVPEVSDPYSGKRGLRDLVLSDHSRTDNWTWTLPSTPVEAIKPDVFLELIVPFTDGREVPLPLMVEYDRTREVAYNLQKLLKWEAFRVAWAREHERFRPYRDHLGALLFVARDRAFLLRLMQAVDRGFTTSKGERLPGLEGAIGHGGDLWYFAGRQNLYFALEEDLYRGSTRVFQVPPCPPWLREQVGQPTAFQFHRTELLPPLPSDEQRQSGRGWRGLPKREHEGDL